MGSIVYENGIGLINMLLDGPNHFIGKRITSFCNPYKDFKKPERIVGK